MLLFKTVVPKCIACACLSQPFLLVPITELLNSGVSLELLFFRNADPNHGSAQLEKNFSPVLLTPCTCLQEGEALCPPSIFLVPKHLCTGKEIQEQGFIQATGEHEKTAYKTEATCKRKTFFHQVWPQPIYCHSQCFGLLHVCHKCSLKFSTLMHDVKPGLESFCFTMQTLVEKKNITKRITKA